MMPKNGQMEWSNALTIGLWIMVILLFVSIVLICICYGVVHDRTSRPGAVVDFIMMGL